MGFSVAFWNVENFWGRNARAEKVAKHIRDLSPRTNGPDVIGFCEFKDKAPVRTLIMRHFKDYDFGLTDTGGLKAYQRGLPEIELLIGWRHGAFDQAVFTQRVDLKAGQDTVRPGGLLNVRQARTWYSVLFLHAKSGTEKTSYQLRQKAFQRVWRLKKSLDDIEPSGAGSGRCRLIVLGDLNTMGYKEGRAVRVAGSREVDALYRAAQANGMLVPAKEHDDTFRKQYSGGRKLVSSLDHVLATPRVKLRRLGRRPEDGEPYYVAVRGWNQLLGDRGALARYQKTMSDHSALYVEVR